MICTRLATNANGSNWEGGSSSQTSGTADTTYPTTNVGWFWREGGLQTNMLFPNIFHTFGASGTEVWAVHWGHNKHHVKIVMRFLSLIYSLPNRPLKQNEAVMALSFCVEETGHGRWILTAGRIFRNSFAHIQLFYWKPPGPDCASNLALFRRDRETEGRKSNPDDIAWSDASPFLQSEHVVFQWSKSFMTGQAAASFFSVREDGSRSSQHWNSPNVLLHTFVAFFSPWYGNLTLLPCWMESCALRAGGDACSFFFWHASWQLASWS